jgi:hypothetical protein
MKNRNVFLLGLLVVLLAVIGFTMMACGGDDTGGNNSGGNNSGGNNSGGGKITITLLAGSGTGNIKLKLSEGTWNSSGAWDATQSSNLNSIMNNLLTTYPSGTIVGSKCTATVIENNSALNIELKNSDDLLEICGEVHVKASLNPVTFPYTSHEGASLSEEFQVVGDPVSFVNKTRLYADISTPWKNSPRQITISESQIEFLLVSNTASYVYAYNINTWKSAYVSGQYCVTIDVSNGKKTSGYDSPPSCITDKTSFTFKYDSLNNSISIRQVNGGTFSGTDGWDNSFTK